MRLKYSPIVQKKTLKYSELHRKSCGRGGTRLYMWLSQTCAVAIRPSFRNVCTCETNIDQLCVLLSGDMLSILKQGSPTNIPPCSLCWAPHPRMHELTGKGWATGGKYINSFVYLFKQKPFLITPAKGKPLGKCFLPLTEKAGVYGKYSTVFMLCHLKLGFVQWTKWILVIL